MQQADLAPQISGMVRTWLLNEQVMFTVRLHYIVAATVLLFCPGDVAQGQTSATDPQKILRAMFATYERVSSYQDSGEVRTLPDDPALKGSSESSNSREGKLPERLIVSFKTFYVRPRGFRLEWQTHFRQMKRTAVIWADGKRVYSWMPSTRPEEDEFTLSKGRTLSEYLDESAGTNAGASFHVPSLLMKVKTPIGQSFADMLIELEELSLLPEEQLEGEMCQVVTGKMSGSPLVLWIGKESHLLRKTRMLYGDGSTGEEIHRDIKINQKIPGEVFKFRPQLRTNDTDLTR